MDIQVYAKHITIEAERDTSNVTLSGVDLSQLIGQLNAEEVLAELDADAIVQFVTQQGLGEA